MPLMPSIRKSPIRADRAFLCFLFVISFGKSPIRADRALRSAHLRHAECALYLRLSFVFIIHALEALYDLNNYDC